MKISLMYRAVFCVLFPLALAGCSYHGQVRRVDTQRAAAKSKFAASVFVAQTDIRPITVSDPSSRALYDFTLDVKTAVYESTADMLAAVFARVETGENIPQTSVDWVAEVSLISELTRSDCTSKQPQLAARQNGVCSELTLTFYPAGKTTPLATFSARSWRVFDKPGTAAVIRFINKWTLYALSPVLLPAYTQLQGNQLRTQVQNQLQEVLGDIQKQLQAREDFLLTH